MASHIPTYLRKVFVRIKRGSVFVLTGMVLGAGFLLMYQRYSNPLPVRETGTTLNLRDLVQASDSAHVDYQASFVLEPVAEDTLITHGSTSVPTITMVLQHRKLPRPFLALDKDRLREQYLAVFEGRELVQEVIAKSASDQFQLELGAGAANLGLSGLSSASHQGTYSLSVGYSRAYQTVLTSYAIRTGIPGYPRTNGSFDKTSELLRLIHQMDLPDTNMRQQIAKNLLENQIDSTLYHLDHLPLDVPYLFQTAFELTQTTDSHSTFRGEHPVNRLLRLTGKTQQVDLVMRIPASFLNPGRQANLQTGRSNTYEVFGFVETVVQHPDGPWEVWLSVVGVI